MLLLYVYVKRRIKHKRIQTVQRDILQMYMAIGNTYKIILFHLLMACRVELEVKHDEEPPRHCSLLNTTPGSNPYCKLTIIICK